MTNTDQLTYYYDDATRPDLLTRVADAASATKGFKYLASASSPHYTYDLNGNLTLDKHKAIIFTYNHLNLPNTMTVTGGSAITMTYTADGEKLTKVSPAGTRNYVAGIEYLGANTEAIYHAEGRCTPNGASAFHYEYTLKDHLGNARVNFRPASHYKISKMANQTRTYLHRCSLSSTNYKRFQERMGLWPSDANKSIIR